MPPTAHSLHLDNHRALVELYGESYTWGAVTFLGLIDDVQISDQPYEVEAPMNGHVLIVERDLLGETMPARNDTITDENGVRYRVYETPHKRRNWPLVELLLVPVTG